jgi:hypothetical protein
MCPEGIAFGAKIPPETRKTSRLKTVVIFRRKAYNKGKMQADHREHLPV